MTSAQLRTILLATDGSDDARAAERAALDLQRGTGAALHVAHVWRYPAGISAGATLPMSANTYELFEEGAEAILDASAERIIAAGATVTGQHLLHGPIIDEIAALAQALAADLVLLGSRGLGPVRRLVLGSVSEGLIHCAPCPVLVMRGGTKTWPPARVVVGDDGSANAAIAAGTAAVIAEAMGAQLTLAQAIPDEPGFPRPGTEKLREMIVAVEAGMRERVARLTSRGAGQTHFVAAVDDPAALLLRLAESAPEPALIVVGSRGLRLFERLRLGSVSTKVLHAAPCPVMVTPQRAD